MKKINFEEKTKALNKLKEQSANKNFTRNELIKELKSLGFNSLVIGAMIPSLFNYVARGNSRTYSFPKGSISKENIKACYDRCNNYKHNTPIKNNSKLLSDEEKALNLLTSKGYQIRKCIGFDLERFAKENPELYKKYLKYEII